MSRAKATSPTKVELVRLRANDQIYFEMENPIKELRDAAEILDAIILDVDEPPVWLTRAVSRMAQALQCQYYGGKCDTS